ncbi:MULTISPECIES: helix-turn-helix domain-containing protein [unclassified Streptomyces]|uniref:helix-turn-helix domain-containing protein n=1 Tax=unclassified Streptomyces TaxID=2593676 RepID=UPI002DD9717E|nr:helix-turn-helix transcriptional regulator [Streptomyces sp. NBC_01763]WSC35687.1 helix-turn-helix transcriptional regulator [Streptomyces sp. NBC_01763]WSF88077.1 helix-turn-helix transcriptional regulator [Streptomyces sp. NBC_01744]
MADPAVNECVARAIREDRLALGLTKRQASEAADVTYMTYRQAEKGAGVRDTTYAAIERAFNRPPGRYRAIREGAPPSTPNVSTDTPPTVSTADFELDINDSREVRIFAITDLPEEERIWHILQMRHRDAQRRSGQHITSIEHKAGA